jgi:POT family proton-dependent oligopeptide transporter
VLPVLLAWAKRSRLLSGLYAYGIRFLVIMFNPQFQFNTFFVYVTPFLGAILADTKWGRYKTICVFTVVILWVSFRSNLLGLLIDEYSLGHIILVGSATPSSLEHPQAALGLLVLAIFVMAVGAGWVSSYCLIIQL